VSQSLERALDLLDKLVDGPKRLGPLAEELQIHKSTALRLLQTLERYGFVRRRGEIPEFMLGFRLVQLSQSLLEELDIRPVAELPLKRLGEKTGETVHLAVLDGEEVVYLDKVESVHPVRMYSKVGARAPAYCTGVGKVLLAFTDEARWPALKMRRFTEHTITTRAGMVRAAQEIRERGWGQDEREHEDTIRCIAAPVFGPGGDVVAAVSVSVPTSRLSRQELDEFVPALLEATDAISAGLGARQRGRAVPGAARAQTA
jgi:DNA-binding IclR family transcriptional regulator